MKHKDRNKLAAIVTTIMVSFILLVSAAKVEASPLPPPESVTTYKFIGSVQNDTVRDMITILDKATRTDKVHITLNSGGGDSDAMIAVLRAMARTKAADVAMIVEERCSSACAIILIAAKKVFVPKSAYVMIHMPSSVEDGVVLTSKTISDYPEHLEIYNLARNLYVRYMEAGVLTPSELMRVLAGEDIYINGAEFMKRAERHSK